MEQRVVSGVRQQDDDTLDSNLRPRRLRDYVGQDRLKANLEIAIEASKQRSEALDHLLLYGPPGLGKTTLANIVANEMDASIKITSGPAIERPGDMVSILTRMQPQEVLFIDEVHRLSRVVEEVLYGAMEDFVVSWVIDKGLKARSINLSIQPFTLVGATTRYGMVSSPLRDRFGMTYRLDFYDDKAMETIVERSARILEIDADQEGMAEVARRARGTPRVANRLLKRVRDYAQVMADNVVTGDIAREALARLEVDAPGPGRRGPHGAPVDHRQVRRRAGGRRDAGGRHQRRGRHDHGRVRAVPAPDRVPGPHPPPGGWRHGGPTSTWAPPIPPRSRVLRRETSSSAPPR